jgi:hypothetical protein
VHRPKQKQNDKIEINGQVMLEKRSSVDGDAFYVHFTVNNNTNNNKTIKLVLWDDP